MDSVLGGSSGLVGIESALSMVAVVMVAVVEAVMVDGC